ncbi:MAG: hypothetical protein KIT68_04225 [Phycisphaeraceae bacterium]|nr:hypothetical protein [Phycisphaeraceae bacterium]
MNVDTLSRIAKLFIDRDDELPEEVEVKRKAQRVSIVCGPELQASTAMQAAVLTAAAAASRCFPGAVSVVCNHPDFNLGALGWPQRLSDALSAEHIGVSVLNRVEEGASTIGIGTTAELIPTVQCTFDRWTGAVVPGEGGSRLKEREGNPLAGMLSGALAVSELFLRFARVQVESTRREVGLSLWDPSQLWSGSGDDEPELIEVPDEFWLLGLGHLGQAYSFALSLLPFSDRSAVNVLLQDHDRIVPANLETGLVCSRRDIGQFKARTVASWLEARGFRPRVVERRFDERTRVERGEPRVGLCGFDGGGPRHLLDLAATGFERVVEAGLGGRADNFESMSVHSLPHSERSAAALWPDEPLGDAAARLRHLASSRRAYADVERRQGCGRLELAGRSIGVPFVGATAACLVLSEALRMVHQGKRFDHVELRLAKPSAVSARNVPPGYAGDATVPLSTQPAYRA